MATVKTGMLIQQNLTEKNPRAVLGQREWLWWQSCFYILLRHIWIGLDLWDTGYNYANFQYMGLEHMDSMWLFSTYLATAVGHLLSFLPGAKTLLGMNLYTGLICESSGGNGLFFLYQKAENASSHGLFGRMDCRKPLLVSYGAFIQLSDLCAVSGSNAAFVSGADRREKEISCGSGYLPWQ